MWRVRVCAHIEIKRNKQKIRERNNLMRPKKKKEKKCPARELYTRFFSRFFNSRPTPPLVPLAQNRTAERFSTSGEGNRPRITVDLTWCIFFFLLSAEACINSYAGALRGRSPDSMSGTGMSSIHPHFFFLRSHLSIYRTKIKFLKNQPTAKKAKKYTDTTIVYCRPVDPPGGSYRLYRLILSVPQCTLTETRGQRLLIYIFIIFQNFL